MVLVRSEVLGQFVNTITAVYNYIYGNKPSESGEFTATSSNAEISKTKNFFSIFYSFNEFYVKFRVF